MTAMQKVLPNNTKAKKEPGELAKLLGGN